MYLFGSFAWSAVVRPESDIDLAAEGLAGSKLIFADVRLSEASKYEVDLVRLERLPTLLRELILKSGVLVYNRQPKKLLTTTLRDEIGKLRQLQKVDC